MTNREFYNAIISANVAEDVKAFAKDEIAKLDKKNEKRRNTPNKTQVANEPLKAKILELLASGKKVASEIASALEVSTQKASSLCLQLVKDGLLVSSDVKVKGKGAVKGYSLAPSADEAEEVEPTDSENK